MNPAKAAAELGDPNIWSQFGLAGLVIFALFGLVIYLIRQNKDERAEWRSSHEKTADGLGLVIKELTVAIREIEKK